MTILSPSFTLPTAEEFLLLLSDRTECDMIAQKNTRSAKQMATFVKRGADNDLNVGSFSPNTVVGAESFAAPVKLMLNFCTGG